jgi:NAD+ diphosphatase
VTAGPLGRLALARSTVDTATERRKDEAWLAAAWADPGTQVLRVHHGKTFVAGDRLAPVSPAEAGAGERFLLGVDEHEVVWFAVLEETEPAPPDVDGVVLTGLREVGALLGDRDAGLFVHAVALGNWHATHGRCARCGATTTVEAAGHVRRCTACGTEHFPRTDPAVIVLVTDDAGRALLGHNPRWPANRYSTLAGFVEPGESAEHAVVREIKEESGVDVVDVRYLGSQPWPFPSSLMLGFTARALDPDAVQVDGDEISDARWFSTEDLAAAVASGDVLFPPSVSIARRLVEHWYGGPIPDGPGSW